MQGTPYVVVGSPTARLVTLSTLIAMLVLAGSAAATGASPRPSGPPAPYGVARNGSFAYDLDGDIYVADPTGQNAAAMTSGPDYDVGPAFSRDGTRIAFLKGASDGSERLMVANADGSGVLALTGPLTEVDWYDWSPDGKQLVMWHLIDRVPSISMVATDGSGMRTLDLGDIEPGDRVDWRPPDGRELIFTGHAKSGSPMGLFAIAPDGSGLRTVGAVSTEEHWFNDFQLSPDGSTVGYWAWGPNASGVSDGWSHLRDLATGEDQLIELYGDPRLSPDRTLILGETSAQLVIGPGDGSGPTREIGPSYAGQDRAGYDFSPDGRKIMLTIGDPGVTWIIDVATGDSVATPIPVLPNWQRLAP
jgi:Tol biopolymer transport system component